VDQPLERPTALKRRQCQALPYASCRRGHGEQPFERWEFSSGVDSWEQAPAAAQVGRRLVEGLFERELRLLAGTTGAAA
jgi:hypothetical protein